MNDNEIIIKNAEPGEYNEVGELLVEVYLQLDGFPKPDELPGYYKMLANAGELTLKPGTEIVVAKNRQGHLLGAVVYFDDMKYYGSGGMATSVDNSAGFRLLAVRNVGRGLGIGRSLAQHCIDKAKNSNKHQIILHTTKAMQTAWHMYERMGFVRYHDLDFAQNDLHVFGFTMRFK